MRLFIALNFNNEVKAQIKNIINKVKSNSVQGSFVNEEHMHLTVEFLGEIQKERVCLVKELMDTLKFEEFTLGLTRLGYFKKREGKTYWLGIENNHDLNSLHRSLHQRLLDKGFKLEDREYKPHITLGRKVILKDSFDASVIDGTKSKILIDINKIDLMKSELVDGRLVYSVLYSRQAKR
mgnify:CR=1 FL=1